MAFQGLGKKLVPFLRQLEKSNNRDWFQENKARYQAEVQEPFLEFIRAIEPKLAKISPHIVASDKKVGGSMMRINRDVRFSKDKRPYDARAAARFMNAAGKDVQAPGFYLKIDPKEVWLGAGIWQPDTPSVTKIREAIVDNPTAWKRARDHKAFRDLFGELDGESLKRPPRGFDPEHKFVEDLKRKDFVGFRKLKPAAVAEPGFLAEAVKTYKASTALMRFLSDALGVDF
ncbi:MAG: TIGR02453 family protein [Planctomycetota bacterium]